MKQIILYFLIFIFSTCSLCCAQEEIGWTQVDSSNYINYDNVVGVEDIYGFTFLLKSYNKGQYEPLYGKRIWYTLSQYTLDCSTRKYKIGIIDSYGYSNNFINGDYNRYAKFQPIVKGTAIDSIGQKLCRP